ncbi:tyrosine-protein kinase [Dyadobacter sp. CY343]|uniref:GumC family protein n=1 Tax=Dyadobacter sp. CY343 TaxID=2907299 RepID=UPI001F29B761|nr:tyrosine-protein kinase [Dyadobacter sp. CY343]MCE7063521.1 polysaccharide biosynthesis tyrosine autokinase [Dyadobacter sp. CY343]
MANHNLELITSLRAEEQSVSMHAFLRDILQHWHLFLIGLTMSAVVTAVFLRYATPKYLIESSLLIRDDSRGSNFGDAAALENLGLSVTSSSIDNEIEILKCKSLAENVVDALALHVSYFAEGRVKTTELYDKSPFRIVFLGTEFPGNTLAKYQVVFLKNNEFELLSNKQTVFGKFSDTISIDNRRAVLSKTQHVISEDDKYYLVVENKENSIRKLTASLSVSTANKFASVINLSINETIPEKGEAILSTLISHYISNSIDDKNRVADKTLTFIGQNLALVSSELHKIEGSIEQFRKTNMLLDIEAETQQLIQQASSTSDQYSQFAIKLKIVETIAKYIIDNPTGIIPSSLIQQEANFKELASKYNDLILLRSKNLVTMNKGHPAILAIENQVTGLRADILSALNMQQKELGISLAAFRRSGQGYQDAISKVPPKQRIYLDYTRQQQIKQELYLFLLKKQIETSISRSSTIPNAKVIDPPKADSNPVTPNRQLVFLVSACFGLGIPMAGLHLSKILSDKIPDKNSLAQYCKAPVIAEISYQKGAHSRFLQPDGKSLISEQFRTLRANLLFASGLAGCKTILITSGNAGEGKSFVAANLAQSFAMISEKVLLIELDLRKPTLANYLHVESRGVTDYLLNRSDSDILIQKSGQRQCFDVITSGYPPPNPAELLSTTKFEKLILTLKEKYDHIVIDTPPVGLVTDAHTVRPFVDLTLYVVRQNVTGRQQMHDLNKLFTDNRLSNIHVLYNGFQQASRYYQYYENAEKKGSFFKWKHNFKLTQ